jgi:integrase
MARRATGQVVVREGKRGRVYALRFRAYGRREYLTLDVTTQQQAEEELANVLADVRRGIWRPPRREATIREHEPEPTFHQFASEWLEGRREEGLGKRTLEDYEWALSYHLLPFFKDHRLSAITVREVDRYKVAKARESVLGAATINKTITQLAQILELAVEYGTIPANPARGRRRRLKTEKPRRTFVQPEQLMILLEAAEPLLSRRGRPLLATLAGAGLRIEEALTLERRNVNLAQGR